MAVQQTTIRLHTIRFTTRKVIQTNFEASSQNHKKLITEIPISKLAMKQALDLKPLPDTPSTDRSLRTLIQFKTIATPVSLSSRK